MSDETLEETIANFVALDEESKRCLAVAMLLGLTECRTELARLRDENARLRATCRAARQIALDAVTDAGDRNAPPAMLAVCQAIPADIVGLAACPDIVEIGGEWFISTPWGEELLDGPYPTREAAAQSAAGLDSPSPAP
jgi:hypothetical protein